MYPLSLTNDMAGLFLIQRYRDERLLAHSHSCGKGYSQFLQVAFATVG